MTIQPQDRDFLISFLKTRSGIALTADKDYLLESRLLPIARVHGFNDLAGLVNKLKASPPPALITEVVEAMTTNESLFFRDAKPFEQLREVVLPRLRDSANTRKKLRIWSAACSTGQEPYSVAMTLMEESAKHPGWAYEINGTDLAQKVIDKASAGKFTQFEVQRGLSIQMLVKYFDAQTDTSWQVKPMLRNMVTFKPQNLLQDFTPLGSFDFILCRNVLIYFDEATKADILTRMAKRLSPGGVLMLGGTESVLDKAVPLDTLEGLRGVYTARG